MANSKYAFTVIIAIKLNNVTNKTSSQHREFKYKSQFCIFFDFIIHRAVRVITLVVLV